MQKFKVITVIGTRPEIIRLSRAIAEIDKYFDHILVHTGQNYNYELNQIFFEDLEIRKPDYFLNCSQNSSSVSHTIGKIISGVDEILEKEKPDCMLVLGDTNSCLSVISAKRRKIPIFHMEAGNRCFDMRVPEEINRKIVDHVSDVNLTYSAISREYLIREGVNPDLVIKIGSPMKEVLNYYRKRILTSNIISDLGLKENNYFLVSAHREENIDSNTNIKKIITALNLIGDKYNCPVVISAHPRTTKKIEELGLKSQIGEKILILKPLKFTDYNKLQICSKVVLSDSGTISEESSILNFPAINLREAHERPEAMEEASVIMSGLSARKILQAIEILSNQAKGKNREINLVGDYDTINVSKKLVRTMVSYTDYVNRVVWKKY